MTPDSLFECLLCLLNPIAPLAFTRSPAVFGTILAVVLRLPRDPAEL